MRPPPYRPVFYANDRHEIDIGVIDGDAAAAIGCKPMPIRVEEGIPGDKGFGLAHLESNPSRSKMIKLRGYSSNKAFLFDICENWDTLSQAEKGRYTVSKSSKGYSFKAVLQKREHGGQQYWSVTTALPFRTITTGIFYVKPTR